MNGEHHPEEDEDVAAALKGGKKKGKKKGGRAADLDIDALLAGEAEEVPAPAPEPAEGEISCDVKCAVLAQQAELLVGTFSELQCVLTTRNGHPMA